MIYTILLLLEVFPPQERKKSEFFKRESINSYYVEVNELHP